MKTISGAARGVRRAGVMAVAAFAVTAVSHGRAEALSLASPAGYRQPNTPAKAHRGAQVAMAAEDRGGGGGYHGGGGGGFHGGAIQGGGLRAYHGGGFRAAHIYRGGGYRYGGYRVHAMRLITARSITGGILHRRYYAPYYSSPRYYYGYPRCRMVWTYYGPRKICRYRHWHRHITGVYRTGELIAQLKRNRRPCGRLFSLRRGRIALSPSSRTSRTSS